MQREITTILLVLLSVQLFSQEKITRKENNVTLIIDKELDKLNTLYEEQKNVPGFRIQIYSNAKKQGALTAKSKYLSTNEAEKHKAYQMYQQPHFKIRVGNFKTKYDAYIVLKGLKNDFPNAFIVRDHIDIQTTN